MNKTLEVFKSMPFFPPFKINLLINCSRNIYIFIGDLSRAFSFYFGRLICRHTTNSTSSICVSICSSFFLYDAWLRSFLETTWLWCHVIYGPIYKSLYRFVLKKLFWVLQFWHPRRSISRFPAIALFAANQNPLHKIWFCRLNLLRFVKKRRGL